MSARPLHVVVMGVSATGKTTVGEGLARRLGGAFIEGDEVHSVDNVAKMSAGIALTDADRGPWLAALAAMTAEHHARASSTVIACSALRRSYRDILRGAVPDGETFFVHLHAPPAVLVARMGERTHFMPPSLSASQSDTLEPLAPDEAGITIDASAPLESVVADAHAAITARYGR